MADLAKSAKRKWQQMLGQEPEEEEQGILGGVSCGVEKRETGGRSSCFCLIS